MKQKTGPWSAADTAQLHAVAEGPYRRRDLKALATKLNRPYANLYAKWNSEVKNGKASKKIPAIKMFVIDKTVLTPVKGSEAELRDMKTALDKVISSLGVRNGNIPVPTNKGATLKRYLDTQYPAKQFRLSKIKDNPRISRIFRIK